MKELLLAAALLAAPSNTLSTQQYEPDTSQLYVFTISPQDGNTTAVFGCYPLNPVNEAR